MSTKTLKCIRSVAAALLALAAGNAAAAPPPLPSFDGENPLVSGILPFAGSSGRGVVRTSGGSTGSTVFATVDGTTANIQTNAQRMVIDWQSFNIGEGHRVNFLLPDRASIAVNRVRGVGSEFVSRIDGDLWSNGNVWLLNPNGVFFGSTARVDVAGLLATPAYLKNLDDFIGVDGSIPPNREVGFNMPGSSFQTEVLTPGAIGIAQGAEILVRGGPAMFIAGSGVEGRTLTIGGTVTSRSDDLARGVLTPPDVSSQNGSYSSLLTASDPDEEVSSQVVYAVSGDFALGLETRQLGEPPLPNPLSSSDLDLFDLVIERGFAGKQYETDQVAPDAISIESSAKTVAGQVVVRAAAEDTVVNRSYDPRTDLGDNLGCDPGQPTCTINANPDHDTYLYFPAQGGEDYYELLCAKGPATESCGTLSGEQTAAGFRFSAYLGVESSKRTDYGCGFAPGCSPGIRIGSSLTALDPRQQSSGYNPSMFHSLIVDAAPVEYRGNLPLSRGTDGRLLGVLVFAEPVSGRVFVDGSQGPTRDFDFGGDGGIQGVAVEFVSAGRLRILGRDVCVTASSCFQAGEYYRNDDFFAADHVNLRLQAGSADDIFIAAERLLRLEETYLSRGSLALVGGYPGQSGGGDGGPRQLVIRNALVDPLAGTIAVEPWELAARIVVGSGTTYSDGGNLFTPENDFTLGSIYGDESTEIDVAVRRDLRIEDLDDSGTATPGVVEGRTIQLRAQEVLSLGDIQLRGEIIFEPGQSFPLELTPSLFLAGGGGLSFGRIHAATPRDDLFITSGPDLDFDPVLKLGPDAAVRSLRLYSYEGKVCIGATVAGQCVVTDLDLLAAPVAIGASQPLLEIFGQTGVVAGDLNLDRYIARVRAERGGVRAGDIVAGKLSVEAGVRDGNAGPEWSVTPGAFTVTVGDVDVRNLGGDILLAGRDGVTAGDLSADGGITPPGRSIGLYSKTGSITAGVVTSTTAGDFSLDARTETGALISMASAEAGRVQLDAAGGAIRIGTGSGSSFVAGAVTARASSIDLSGQQGVVAGALAAASRVQVGAELGSVAVGDISAGSAVSKPGTPCDGLAVCIGAGFDGTVGSGRTLTTGAVTATSGGVLMVGRDGVTTGGAVLASAGGVEISSPAGTVDTSAGAVTAGASTGAFDAKITGSSLNLGAVTARRDIDLAATGATGGIATGVLTATRALKVAGVAGFGIEASKIGGTPQSVLVTSSEGGVCLGALVNGVCTGQSLTKDADLTLQGKTGVKTGALTVRSALVDSAQGSLALGDVTVTDGKLALYGKTGVTAGRLTQSRTGTPPAAPNIDLLSTSGAITVGDVSGTGLMYGRAAQGLTTGAIAGVKDIDLRAGEALATGAVTATGFVQLESVEGSLTTGAVSAGAAKVAPDTDPCKGKAVCLRAGEPATAGTQRVDTGALQAAAGDILVRGRSGVTIDSARVDDGSLRLESGFGVVTAGALTARHYIDVNGVGSVRLGALSAAGTVVLATTDACNGASVCVTAGGAQAGTQAATIDAIDAQAGGVVVAAPTVTLGASTARDGDLVVIAGPGGVTATGDLAAGGSGSTAADRDVRVSGGKLVLRGVRASGDIALAADGTQPSSGTLQTGLLEARRDLKLQSVASLAVAAADIGGTPESVDLSSSSGSVCIGASVGGVCTGQSLSKNTTAVALTGRSGVVTGDLAVKSLRVRASEGASVAGAVTSAEGVDIAARDGVKTAGVTAQKAVSLVASSGTVDAGAVTARDGTVLLQGRTGVKAGAITQARTGGALQVPDIDLVADGGSVAVGAVSGTGSLRARALDDVSVGAVSGVDAVQLTAGKALTASGAIAARGAVELRSDTAGVAVQDVTAGAAVTVTARDAVSAGAVVGATTTAGDVTMTSTDGALTAKSVTAGTATVASNATLLAKGRVGVDPLAATLGNVTASGSVRLESQTADVRVGELRATDATLTATGGDVSLGGATARTLTVSAAAGQGGAGDVRIGGPVTLAPAAGTPTGATPALRVQAARDITVAGAVTSERNVAFVAGRNFANTGAISVTAGTAADGTGTAGYGGIDIRAADVDIGAQLRARGAGVNLLATGNGGVALGDGITAPTGALRLSNAELQNIDAPTAALRSAVSATAGRDILVGDFTLDRARIGELTLATRQGGKVRVTGSVRGTGAPALQVGEPGMRPDAIEVSGALGATGAALGTLQLRSAGNILLGPQSFIDAANAAQDILTFDVAAASQGATAGRLFLVGGATSFDAPGAILQQNTGSSTRDGNGILIGAPTGIVTATFATGTPPRRIALFGSVVDAQGSVAGAQRASLVAGLLPTGVAADPAWRINTCIIGTGAGCAATAVLPPPSVLVQPPLPPPPPPSPPQSQPSGSDPAPTAGTPDGPRDRGDIGTDDEDPERETRAVPQLADAPLTAEERRIYPLEIDPGSRDLLRPVEDGTPREPGVGSANEDLWPLLVPQ